MHIFTEVFDQATLQPYIDKIENHYRQCVKTDAALWNSWSARTVDITEDPIVEKVIATLESKLRVELFCHQAQIQIWPEGVDLYFHRHQEDTDGRNRTSLYNSMLYLNDDFRGGEFITEQGVKIEPRVGTLTFFNGNDIRHGVAPFYGNDRFTIIFWWSRQSRWL